MKYIEKGWLPNVISFVASVFRFTYSFLEEVVEVELTTSCMLIIHPTTRAMPSCFCF